MSSKRSKVRPSPAGQLAGSRSSRGRQLTSPWWPVLLLTVAGAAVYLNSFKGVFMFDDFANIVERARIHQLWPVWPLLAARRPAVELSLAINYAVGGLDLWGYHFVNLLIHILAGLTLFGVIRRTLLRRQSNQELGQAPLWLAFVIALIWLVHPIQTQSVTYIIQRSESMMGLFYLLTLYCVIRGTESAPGRSWYVLAVVSCAWGMLSKAVMVTAPAMILFYDRVFLAKSWRELWERRRSLYFGLAMTWLILWNCGIIQSVLDGSNAKASVGFGFKGISPTEYLATQPGVILYYLRLIFWPHPLCLDYAWPVPDTAAAVIGPAIALGLLVTAVVWALWRIPLLGFAGVWFLVILAPTSSFIPIKDPLFEHRLYLPLAAVIASAVGIGYWMFSALAGAGLLGNRARLWLATGMVLVVALVLGATTVRRNRDYHSEIGMWGDIVASRPNNARAHVNLATRMLRRGDRLDEIIKHSRAALRIDPTLAIAHENIGKVFFRQGRVDQAIQSLYRAAALSPDMPGPHFGLGLALEAAGRLGEAVAQYREALRLQPDHPAVRRALSAALIRQQRSTDDEGF